MSRTYKHIEKYKRGEYWKNIEWLRPDRSPLPKDINEPEYHGCRAFCYGSQAKYWYSWSNRKCRRDAKKLINKGKYTEAKHLKPENVDYIIW